MHKCIDKNLDASGCLKKGNPITVVFIYSSGYCEYVRIKNDVIWIELDLFYKETI